MIQFFRGLKASYDLTAHGRDIYFAYDSREILANGVSYGISKEDAEKLNNTVSGVNYDEATHTVTVSYTGSKVASTFVLPVASSTINGLMSTTDKAAFDVLNGTVDVEGSVKKQVADVLTSAKDYADGLNTTMDSRVDALEALTGLGGAGSEEGKSLSEQVSDNATAIANIQKDYMKSTDMSTLMGETSEDDAKTIAALNDKINNVHNITELTYSELKALVDNSELIPGHNYAITDYTCIYKQPISNVEMEIPCPDVKYIICTASTINTLLEDVQYVRNDEYLKIRECKYTIYPEKAAWTTGLTTLQSKGVVYYMEDVKGNACNYDFKHVKFRRWAITDITPNTTPDDGATYPCSPYKVYATDNAKKWSDDRYRIGSGDIRDKNIIEGVFSGKWANATEECKTFFGSTDENPVEFSDQYILESVKPYQDTSHPRNKYLAWTPNMNSNDAFGPTSNGTGITVGHQAVVTTDPNDYIDLYTFDCNGEDASDIGPITGKGTGRIHTTRITRWGIYLGGLPNTVFIITTSLTNVATSTSLFLYNVKIENAYRNTILLQPTTGRNWALWADVEIKDLQKNLLITQNVNSCKWYGKFNNNLIVGGLGTFNTYSAFQNSVLFGDFATVEIGGYAHSLLWYGLARYYRTTTSNNLLSSKDGTYTYEVETEGNFYANILSPMQYCRISAHFNTNSLRAPYFKGVIFEGTNQLCSYGESKWGVHVSYSCGQGIKYGAVKSGTTIGQSAFAVRYRYSTDGVELFNDNLQQLPDLINTQVIAYNGDSEKLANLSDEEKAMLANTSPTELIWHEDSKYWTVNYKRDSVVGNGINKLVKMTQTEYNALTTKDANTLYVITE